jgi:hypothetical protein
VGGDLENNTCPPSYPLGADQSYTSAILLNINSDGPPPYMLTVKACAGRTAKAKTFCDTQSVFLND